jgi:EAL domain-containing protein (putative c-di-GMP-specific phosphodiesterase class I)
VPAQHLVLLVNGADLEALLLEPDGWLSLARDMGLRLGVDDVASVRPDLLRRIDPDLVRLARATIAGLPAARQASEQTGAGIIAGQRIGALVLADGVERAEQREALINLGCYLQQGRLLGEPMAPRDFSRLLSRAEVGAF